MDAHETKIITAVLIGVFILAILLVFFIATLIKHQRRTVELYQQQVNTEITTLEAERRRVASDLHDDLGPSLASMKLQVNLLNTKDAEDLSAIKDLSSQIDDIVEKVRETSNNLMPNVLIRKGLVVAITNFAQRINKTNALVIKTLFDDNVTVDEEKEIHIYRIFQEAINNTLKHGNATHCEINGEVKDHKLHLVITDNGKGFDYESMSKESVGFGLKSILSRVDLLNGDIYVDTKPGQGVKYFIVIPL